jgi:eukaryotic-like serine/threonine-protein kinase
MPLGPGARLGPYEIVAAIGAGGMGEVYKARDTRLERTVAIKVLPAAFSSDPERLARFEQEARAAAALNHPNILALHDVASHEGAPYIVTELLEGETLRERLAGGALPVRKAIEYAIQIAHGLAAAHEKGIVHRDLKPENIFVTNDGRVKILDFGLAKLTQTEPVGGLSELRTTPPNTVAGVVLGTVGYMSPEQVRGVDADHRSDIFAFGAIVHEMLSGQRAFRAETTIDAMTAILKEEPPDLPAERHIPPALARIVDRCLEKNPVRRFQSTRDLAFALESLSTQSGATLAIEGVAAPRNRERVAWALLVVAVMGLVALGVPATLYFRRAVAEPVVTRLDVVTPPTRDAFSFALSPDGRQLAFVASGERGSQLWLRSLDKATAQPLASTEGASFPFWAPDSRVIGFFADGKVKRVDLAGGAPQSLADAPYPRGGTWNADGVIVYAPSVADPLMRVAATGGTAAPVTRLVPGEGSHRWPQFLPDGRRFLFLMATGQSQTQGVYVASLDGDEPKRVMPAETAAAYAAPGYLLLVSQGVLTAHAFDAGRTTVMGEPIPVAQDVGADDGAFHSAFSVSAAGVLAHRTGASARTQLVWVDRTGKVLGAVGQPDENNQGNPALAPDGQRVALSRGVQGNIDLWLIEVGRGVASRFTFDGAVENSPVWSPDGSQIAFRSSRKGVHDLFEKPAGGTADEQPLLVTSQGKSPLDWSRDGRLLLYGTQDPKTGSDLWVLPMMGERKPFAVLQSSFDEIEGQFSPDGRWLAYASNESGRYEIYVRTFPEAGGKWQVSVAGGLQPRWKLDGRELFYVAPDTRLMAVPLRLVPDTHALEAGTPVPLFRTQLATGPNIAPAGFQARAQYAVAADGRFLMNIAADEAVRSPITIVQNWMAALKK